MLFLNNPKLKGVEFFGFCIIPLGTELCWHAFSHLSIIYVADPQKQPKPIFGVPLAVAVDRNKSHDGIQLPVIFRECVDYIEEFGRYAVISLPVLLVVINEI